MAAQMLYNASKELAENEIDSSTYVVSSENKVGYNQVNALSRLFTFTWNFSHQHTLN